MEHLTIYLNGLLGILALICYYIIFHTVGNYVFKVNIDKQALFYIVLMPLIIPFTLFIALSIPYLIGAYLPWSI